MPVVAPGTWCNRPQLPSPVQLLLAPLSIFLGGRRPTTAVKLQMGNKQSVVDCGDSLQDCSSLERNVSVSRKSAVSRCWECRVHPYGQLLVVEMELEDGEMPLHIFIMTESTQLLNCKGICFLLIKYWLM